MSYSRLLFLLTAVLITQPEVVGCDEKNSQTSSASQFQISEDEDGFTIEVSGELFARYITSSANKPYFWPIIGPTGRPMTRAFPMKLVDHESEQQRDHPHHRGLLFGHQSVGLKGWQQPKSGAEWEQALAKNRSNIGGDSWHEPATFETQDKTPKQRRTAILTSIKHREFKQLSADENRAVVVEVCDHIDRDGKRFLTETRRFEFRVAKDARSIDFDQTFVASDGDVVFEDQKDAGIAIRVPSSMAIDSKQGGVVINSDGQPCKKAWGRPAKWCDYHGPVDDENLGIAFLCHPTSYRFPSRWHVREYGLFAANPFGLKSFNRKLTDGATRLSKGEKLMLRHRLIFHKGDAKAAKIQSAWRAYAKESRSYESE